MRKQFSFCTICVLLGVILIQIPLAAGSLSESRAAESIVLTPAEWLDEDAEYMLLAHKTPFIATAALISAAGDHDGSISPDTDVTQSKLPASEVAAIGLYPLSISPDGSTTLLSNGQKLFILKDLKLTEVCMNLSRCDYTKKYGYKQALDFMSIKISDWAGAEGWVWSPDSRYVSINNANIFFYQMRSRHGLLLLDTEKAELFSAKAYETNTIKDENFGAVTGTCFDESGRFLYYTEYGRNGTALFLYDIGQGSHELLCTANGIPACTGLCINAQGGLECFLYDSKNYWHAAFLEKDGSWSVEKTPVRGIGAPVFFTLLPSGTGFTQFRTKTQNQMTLFTLANHIGQWLTVPLAGSGAAEYAEVIPLPEKEEDFENWQTELTASEPQQLYVMHIALSPDHANALLAVRNQFTKEGMLLLMDVNTLKLRAVNTSAIPGDNWVLDVIRFGNNKQYQPGLIFTGKDCVLVPLAGGGTGLYRLEYK